MSRISSLFTPVSTVPSDIPRSPALPTRPGSRSGSHNTFDNNMDDLMLLDDVRPSPTCDTPLSRTPTRQIVTPVSSMCHPQADGYRRAISMLSLPSMKCATPQESLTKGSSPHGRHRVMCDSPSISPVQYSSVDSISKAVPPSYYNHCQVGVPETVSKWQDEAARLNALVCSLQQELHRESCKHQQERDTLEWNNEILNKKIENLRQQSDLESKNLEHKVANLTEQNRMQGEQVLQLGRSMSSLRMENQRLEMELLRVRPADSYPLVDRYGSDSHSDSVSRRAHEEALATAQARTVELAKKLLECERGKTAAEKALIAVHKRGMSDDSNNNNCRDSSSRERTTSDVVGVVGCMGPTQDTSSIITELQTRLAASEKRAAYLYNINNNRQAELQALQDNYVSEKKRRTRDLINIRHAYKKVSSELLLSQEYVSELYIERDNAIHIIQTLGSMYKDIYSNRDNNNNNSLLNNINDFLNNISLNNNIRNNNIRNNNISSISSNSGSQDKWRSTANRDNNITMFDNIIHSLRNNNNNINNINNNSDYDSDIYIDTPIRVHSSDRDADGDDGGLGDNNNNNTNNINNSINNNNNNNNYVTKLEDSVITANEKETVYKEHIDILNNHIEYLERQLNTNKPEMWGLYNNNNNINNNNTGINRRTSDVDLVSSLNISSGDYCNNNNNEYNMVSP